MADQPQRCLGDRVGIYKYKGRDNHRGIVSLGEILTDPQAMDIPAGTDPYEVISNSYGRPIPVHAEWSWVRYVRAPAGLRRRVRRPCPDGRGACSRTCRKD